eukprot:GHVU01160386.1.p1 GENE.GHVU01160386.1~~GHVU01160386.1.p1  ORF type:complete len:416 (-),score=50.15 GHVU01160386.1:163-1410(-)
MLPWNYDEQADPDPTDASSVLPPEMYVVGGGHDQWIPVDGGLVHKRTFLKGKTGIIKLSNDRLRRVRGFGKSDTSPIHDSVCDATAFDDALCLRDPAATLCIANNQMCLVVFAVISIKVGGNYVYAAMPDKLNESFEIVGQPMNLYSDDEHALKWGLSNNAILFPDRFTVGGNLVYPLSPAHEQAGEEMTMVFDLMTLGDLANRIWAENQQRLQACLKLVPRVRKECVPLDHTGSPLNVCDLGTDNVQDDSKTSCRICGMKVHNRHLRAHIGSHILTGTGGGEHTEMTCGFCGGNECSYEVGSKESIQFQCSYAQPYKRASALNDKSACTNVVLKCSLCAEQATGRGRSRVQCHFWKYNMRVHWEANHEGVDFPAEFAYSVEQELASINKKGVACQDAAQLVSSARQPRTRKSRT